MNRVHLASLALFASSLAWARGDGTLKGDYIEVRTASVFAGACHANGEVVTTGNDAILAWKIQSGQWRGTSLAGVRAIAILKGDKNLALTQNRQAELIVDSSASQAQLDAVLAAFKEKYGSSLGKVVSVHRAPIAFQHRGTQYRVESPGVASLAVEALPNNECCTMPSNVWYEPLVPLSNRKVGYTKNAAFNGGAVGDAWRRADENSAFYGSFSI